MNPFGKRHNKMKIEILSNEKIPTKELESLKADLIETLSKYVRVRFNLYGINDTIISIDYTEWGSYNKSELELTIAIHAMNMTRICLERNVINHNDCIIEVGAL